MNPSFLSMSLFLCFLLALPSGVQSCASTTGGGVSSDQAQGAGPLRLKPGQGALWFPTIWSVRLYHGGASGQQAAVMGDALSELRLRGVRLVLRDSQTQDETSLDGRALDPAEPGSADSTTGSSAAILDLDNVERHFAFGPVAVLAEGNYRLESFQAEVVDTASGRPQTLTLPIAHPLDPEDPGPLSLAVQKGSISVAGRFAFETEFGIRQGKLTAQTRSENLERGRVPAQSLRKDLGLGGVSETFDWPLVKASPLVPELRHSVPVVDPKDKEIPRGLVPVGFSLRAPCGLQAVIKFVFRYEASAQEQVALLSLDPKGGDEVCENGFRQEYALLLFEPRNALLLATEIVSEAKVVPNSRLGFLRRPSEAVKRFFGMEKTGDFLLSRIEGEQQLSRRFALPLADLRVQDSQRFYAGAFALESNASANGTSRVWSLLLQKRYDTARLAAAFGVTQVWSPYTGTRIEVPQKEGRVEAVLEVSAAASKSASLSPFVDEIRKSLTRSFATCVEKAEEGDPLVVTSGVVKFRFRVKQRAGAIDELKLTPAPGTQAIETCFRSAFDVFRFTKPTPAAFEGSMRLEAK